MLYFTAKGGMILKRSIVICGCRDFCDKRVFAEFVDECISKTAYNCGLRIISGHCSGVDAMAEEYAAEHGFQLDIFPADWQKYGRAAGPKRNMQMAKQADFVIAFWVGSSRGTKNMIDAAAKLNKAVFVKMI